MFAVVGCSEIPIIKDMLSRCGAKYHDEDILNMVLIADNEIIGVSVGGIEGNKAFVRYICLLEEWRGKGYGDMLSRATINKLSKTSDMVVINGIRDYFERFGFIRIGDEMLCKSDELVFPSKCKE